MPAVFIGPTEYLGSVPILQFQLYERFPACTWQNGELVCQIDYVFTSPNHNIVKMIYLAKVIVL